MKKEITNEYGCLVKLKTKLLVNINISKYRKNIEHGMKRSMVRNWLFENRECSFLKYLLFIII